MRLKNATTAAAAAAVAKINRERQNNEIKNVSLLHCYFKSILNQISKKFILI